MIIVHSVNLGFKNRRVAVLKYILAYSVYVKCKNIYIYIFGLLTCMAERRINQYHGYNQQHVLWNLEADPTIAAFCFIWFLNTVCSK